MKRETPQQLLSLWSQLDVHLTAVAAVAATADQTARREPVHEADPAVRAGRVTIRR